MEGLQGTMAPLHPKLETLRDRLDDGFAVEEILSDEHGITIHLRRADVRELMFIGPAEAAGILGIDSIHAPQLPGLS